MILTMFILSDNQYLIVRYADRLYFRYKTSLTNSSSQMLRTRKKLTVDRYSYKNKIYILCIIEHIPTYDTRPECGQQQSVRFILQKK